MSYTITKNTDENNREKKKEKGGVFKMILGGQE